MNKSDFSFTISSNINGNWPLMRAGTIHTPHGDIETPSFNVVGTRGCVRFMSPGQLTSLGTQTMISNGYHLYHRATVVSAAGGLAKWSGWNRPTFTDSGGFQVMSLGSGLGKIISMDVPEHGSKQLTEPDERMALVDEEGVEFRDPYSGRIIKFTPELSVATQHKLGSDVMMSFDELTNISDSYDYNVRALERTRCWAKRGLAEHIRQTKLRSNKPYQALYGVLQGGFYHDLRAKAAGDLSSMLIDDWGFDGFGLGGALAKDNLAEILATMCQILPRNKPRHLLGLSHPDDIFTGIETGTDTFDCVAPTREARHGRIYALDGNYNLKQSIYRTDQATLDQDCDCPTCREGYNRGDLRALLKSPDLADHARAFTLLSLHNVRFIVRLCQQTRSAIMDGSYQQFKTEFCHRYYRR